MRRTWIAAAAAVLVLALFAAGITLSSRRGLGAVMRCGDYSLDNTGFSYYYWSEYFYFSDAYGDYLADTVDFSRPLAEQAYSADQSWEDYLVEETLNSVRDTMVMVFEAEAAGFALPTDYEATYRQVLVDFASAAQAQGYSDLNAYLQASYGRLANEESFSAYLYDSHLASAYADHLLAQLQPTDEEVRTYFSLHRGSYVEEEGFDPEDETQWLEAVRTDLINDTYQNLFLSRGTNIPFRSTAAPSC